MNFTSFFCISFFCKGQNNPLWFEGSLPYDNHLSHVKKKKKKRDHASIYVMFISRARHSIIPLLCIAYVHRHFLNKRVVLILRSSVCTDWRGGSGFVLRLREENKILHPRN